MIAATMQIKPSQMAFRTFVGQSGSRSVIVPIIGVRKLPAYARDLPNQLIFSDELTRSYLIFKFRPLLCSYPRFWQGFRCHPYGCCR